MSVVIIIPYRDRGTDPLRAANLDRVLQHWTGYPAHFYFVDDGRSGAAAFNRSAAYNRGAAMTDAEVLVYTEADMLVDYAQVTEAVELARQEPGLVIPFTQYRYLSPADSEAVRRRRKPTWRCTPEHVMDDGQSIGAINVVSRRSIELVGGWDEAFEGNWYDDNAMKIAFEICAGPTRWVDGPAYHLYHLPGHKGEHLTDADRAATAANKARLGRYQQATTPDEIRQLTGARCSEIS